MSVSLLRTTSDKCQWNTTDETVNGSKKQPRTENDKLKQDYRFVDSFDKPRGWSIRAKTEWSVWDYMRQEIAGTDTHCPPLQHGRAWGWV